MGGRYPGAVKNLLHIALLLSAFFHGFAAEPKWGGWHLVPATSSVRVEYRTKTYVTKSATQTAIQWKVTNLNGGPVNVELSKTYQSHVQTQRREKVSNLAVGKVYDPSPDYVPGVVNNVQVAVSVTVTGESQKQPTKP